MYLSQNKIKILYRTKGLSLKKLLSLANVSKTAYYNLLYKDTLLPNSIHRIAKILGVQPSTLLEESNSEEEKMKRILDLTDKIAVSLPELDRENVRHTLILLQEGPIERLRRSLTRGQKLNILR